MIERKCFRCNQHVDWEIRVVTYSNGRNHLQGTCPICHQTTLLPQDKKPEECIFHFGKHKGKNITEVPDDYLIWALEKDVVSGGMAYGILDYLESRGIDVKNYRKL